MICPYDEQQCEHPRCLSLNSNYRDERCVANAAGTRRFGAQCRAFYSVARHSVLVAKQLLAEFARLAGGGNG